MKVYSPKLTKALELRKQGIPEARVWLEKACADGDAEALFFKYVAIRFGGFYFRQGPLSQWMPFLYESAQLKCSWALFEKGRLDDENDFYFQEIMKTGDNFVNAQCYYFGRGGVKNDGMARDLFVKAQNEGNCPFVIQGFPKIFEKDVYREWLRKGAMEGDANFQYRFSYQFEGKESFHWLQTTAKQLHNESLYELGLRYLDGDGAKMDPVMAARCFVHAKSTFVITIQLKRTSRTDVLFVYGQAAQNDESFIDLWEDKLLLKRATGFYEDSTRLARRTALCFCWVMKNNKYLSSDIVKVIAKDVYKSREDPDIWLK